MDMELYSLSDFNLKEFSFNVEDTESESEEDMNIDNFFEEVESTPEPSKEEVSHKKIKQVTCPHCNEVFEVEL